MGQLAERGSNAAFGSPECAHNALWIQVAMVWAGSDSTKYITACPAASSGIV